MEKFFLKKSWEEVEETFREALANLRDVAPVPDVIPTFTIKEKKKYIKVFQKYDKWLSQLRAFTNFDGKSIEDYGITTQEHEDYVAHYHNIIEELRVDNGDDGDDTPDIVDMDYELLTYGRDTIDYDYILGLIQSIVTSIDEDDSDIQQKRIDEVREYILQISKDNSKLALLLLQILDNICANKDFYKGKNISYVIEEMKHDAMSSIINSFVAKWYVDEDAVRYAMEYNKNGEIPNKNVLKDSIDYKAYKESVETPLTKYGCRDAMIKELEEIIVSEIIPLQQR